MTVSTLADVEAISCASIMDAANAPTVLTEADAAKAYQASVSALLFSGYTFSHEIHVALEGMPADSREWQELYAAVNAANLSTQCLRLALERSKLYGKAPF